MPLSKGAIRAIAIRRRAGIQPAATDISTRIAGAVVHRPAVRQLRYARAEPYESHPAHVDRMIAVLAGAGYSAPREDVRDAWSAHANAFEAHWATPPHDDGELLAVLLVLLEERA